MTAQTPMLKQYFDIRAENPGVLLAMRVGDFYEFYGPDAETAAQVLGITLTGRDDKGDRIPMAGVPFHAVERYLARLVAGGHKVALCEQLEDAKHAKGLVRRGVSRVLTPGTVLDEAMLEAGANNFLAAICRIEGKIGFAYLDASTGEFLATELIGDGAADRLLQELARVRPAELLAGEEMEEIGDLAHTGLGSAVSSELAPKAALATRRLQERFEVETLAGFGLEEKPSAVAAAAMVLGYAERSGPLAYVEGVRAYSSDAFLTMDPATRRAL
ncbi:MAG: DNA mismatch repair protein MutS, partial [Armatimonadota bacterium]